MKDNFDKKNMPVKENKGYCVICESETTFVAENNWLRDHYFCTKCHSIPRHRALINAMNKFIPDWKNKTIHESSPCGTSSDYITRKAEKYTYSQYWPNVKPGENVGNVRCENLEKMTFEKEKFDIFITQDVFEHVLRPDRAFYEISRVLKKGGIHIFTMPWYPNQNTEIRAKPNGGGGVIHLKDPIYHGNPVDEKGSLVTVDWGIDFVEYIYKHSKMATMIYLYENEYYGLEAEFLHIFVSWKRR